MNNWQLFIAAGLPTLTVLVAMWRSDKRMDGLDARLDRMDARFDHVEGRIDRVGDTLHEIHLMLGRHDARLDSLEKK